jgi:hypothetical protein
MRGKAETAPATRGEARSASASLSVGSLIPYFGARKTEIRA